MEGFKKITSKVGNKKFPVSIDYPSVTYYQASGKLYFNAEATKKFNLTGFRYADLYLKEKEEILVVPSNARSSGSVKFTRSPAGLTLHFKGVAKNHELDMSKIKNARLKQVTDGLVFSINPESAELPIKKFEVTGHMNVMFTTEYVGDFYEAKVKLLEHISEVLAGTVDFTDGDVLMTNVEEVV